MLLHRTIVCALSLSLPAILLAACAGSNSAGSGGATSSTTSSGASTSSQTSSGSGGTSAQTSSGSGSGVDAGDGGPCGAYVEVKGAGEDQTLSAGCFSQEENAVLAGPTVVLPKGELNVVVLSGCKTAGVSAPSVAFRLGNGAAITADLVLPGKSYTVGSATLSPQMVYRDAQGKEWTATEGTLSFTGMETGVVIGNYTASFALPADAGVSTVKMLSGGFRVCRLESLVP